MRKIKMRRSLATAERGYRPGEVVDVEDQVAEAWITTGAAEEYEEEQDPAEVIAVMEVQLEAAAAEVEQGAASLAEMKAALAETDAHRNELRARVEQMTGAVQAAEARAAAAEQRVAEMEKAAAGDGAAPRTRRTRGG